MPTKTGEPNKVNLRGVDWKKPMSISPEKYNEVSKAILAGLTAEPITFTELSQRVARQLPNFKDPVSWYTVSVARELEVQGRVVRQERPVLYAKAGKAAAGNPSKNKATAAPRRTQSAA